MAARFPDNGKECIKAIKKIRDNSDSVNFKVYMKWYESKTGHVREHHEDLLEAGHFREHVAGPHCDVYHGYNGSSISAGAMKYCTTRQFIARYDGDWHGKSRGLHESEPDDEDFECQGVYHLTGLADRCGSFEDDNCRVHPKSHGMSEVNPMQYGGFEGGEPPFRPYRLEVYRRVSMLRLSTDDLTGLTEWIDKRTWKSADYDDEPLYHPAVLCGAEQWWFHTRGDEFLAAYPLNDPEFRSILESAKRPQQDFNAKSSPFAATASDTRATADLCGRLPGEIRNTILVTLGSKDIASLRTASRSFRHLPFTLWHNLMKKEMPWIWEAWTDRPYPLMACTTKQEFIEHDINIQTRKEMVPGYMVAEAFRRSRVGP